jgi:uncharacterized protein YoaH (UPF0181 family)
VERVVEAFRLVERLSSEGVDVSGQIAALNRALELYAENRTGEADALVAEAVRQLESLEQQLPRIRAARWASLGLTVAALAAVPPLFYYFFPRLYALAWAYARGRWLVRKRGNRR